MLVIEHEKMNDFLLHYIKVIDDKNVRHKLRKLIDDKLYKQLLHDYSSHTLKIIIKPLMNEYYDMKANNELDASSKEERWEQFLNSISNKHFISYFNKKYLVMTNQLRIRFNDYINFCLEIIDAYETDCPQISQQYKGLGRIISISTAFGDLHNGKTVSLVEFEHGKLMYKPRDLNNDLLFYNVVEWLSKYLSDVTFYYPFILSRNNYGWQEFIPYVECENEEQVSQFYSEAGVYLFVLYLLNASDMHYENLICHGSHPFIVDFETISQAYIKSLNLENEKKGFELSVLSTLFIPYVPTGGMFDMNMSALFAKDEISNTLEVEVLVEDDKLDWIFSKQKAGINAGSNIVKLQGKPVENQKLKKKFIESFEESAEIVLSQKDEFLKFLKSLLDDREYKSRQILRPTQVYHRYIEVSYHPELLSNSVAFDHIFDTFLNKFEPSNHGYLRVEYEIKEMKKGNIPSFYATFNSRNLYADGQIVCENYYADTIRNNIINKIRILDMEHINYQIELIDMSITSMIEEENYICENDFLKEKVFW
jgi:type 2 lantibiotic biosynthesis protein LanM